MSLITALSVVAYLLYSVAVVSPYRNCPRSPLCATNGVTYKSECDFRTAQIDDHDLQVLYDGDCKNYLVLKKPKAKKKNNTDRNHHKTKVKWQTPQTLSKKTQKEANLGEGLWKHEIVVLQAVDASQNPRIHRPRTLVSDELHRASWISNMYREPVARLEECLDMLYQLLPEQAHIGSRGARQCPVIIISPKDHKFLKHLELHPARKYFTMNNWVDDKVRNHFLQKIIQGIKLKVSKDNDSNDALKAFPYVAVSDFSETETEF